MKTITKQEDTRFYLIQRDSQVLGFSLYLGQLFRRIDCFGILGVGQELVYKDGKYLTWYDSEQELANAVNNIKSDNTYYQITMYGEADYDFNLE